MELRLHILRAESTTVALNWLPTLAVCAAVTAWVLAYAAPESHEATRGAVGCPGNSLDSNSSLPQRSSAVDMPNMPAAMHNLTDPDVSSLGRFSANGAYAVGRSGQGRSGCGWHSVALASLFFAAPSSQIVPPVPPQIPPPVPKAEPLTPAAPVVPRIAAPPAPQQPPSQAGPDGPAPPRQQEKLPAPQDESPSSPPGGTVHLSP